MQDTFDTEKLVIGAVIAFGQDDQDVCSALDTLPTSAFANAMHGKIWDAAQQLRNDGREINEATLVGLLPDCRPHIYDYPTSIHTTATLPEYCRQLLVERDRRDMHAVLGQAHDATVAPLFDFEDVLAIFNRALSAFTSRGKAMCDSMQQSICGYITKTIQAIAAPPKTIRTGISRIDRYMPTGLRGGQLVILGARPGVGKSALALQMALHAGKESGSPALFVSLEMSKDEIVERAMACVCDIEMHLFKSHRPTEEHLNLQRTLEKKMSDCKMLICDELVTNVATIRAIARREKQRHNGLSVVVIDYLQLLRATGANREQEVADISRSLKMLARELDVPIIALSQLNRLSESSGDGEPDLSHLRESGAIEQDADAVILLWQNRKEHDQVGWRLAKNRAGPIAKGELKFHRAKMRFTSPD